MSSTRKIWHHVTRPDGTVEKVEGPAAPRGREGTWPVLSDAAGVHPDQVPETRDYLASQGVRCEFTEDGRAIMESPRHQAKVCAAMGLHNKDGVFSSDYLEGARNY